jgi:hypothetical protein
MDLNLDYLNFLDTYFKITEHRRVQILTDLFRSIELNVTFSLRYKRIIKFSVLFIT